MHPTLSCPPPPPSPQVCDRHDPAFYPKFKKWCDEYFLIKHRGETRGLGGIFFDDLNDREADKILAFSTDCVNSVVDAYCPLVTKHKDDAFTPEEKAWQQMRRGRWVACWLWAWGVCLGARGGTAEVAACMHWRRGSPTSNRGGGGMCGMRPAVMLQCVHFMFPSQCMLNTWVWSCPGWRPSTRPPC